MNIKDSYLHGGTHVVKNINFSIAASGTNLNKLVATITWAEEGSSNTELAIPISGATFGSLTKNTVFAAPNGSNGVPSFRTLVAADIPNISANKITSDTLGADRLPLATNSARGAVILGVAKTSDADSAITGKKYWVKMNANGKLFIDVPWNDNTHYTAVPILGGTDATSNATSDTANNATYLNIIENSAKSGGIKITGSGATTVKANGGVLTINSTNTWKAANSSQEGYVPKLASGGTALSNSTNDYILAFTYADGILTPSWKKLPANAYLNNTYTVNNATYSIKSKIGDTTTTLSDFTANQSSADDFTLIQGSNITFTNDATNRTLTIAGTPNTTYKLTLNGTVKGTTGGTDLGTFYAIATSNASAANLVWMRNSANDAYTWRTLGSRAFDSTSYIPLAGSSTTSPITGTLYIKDADGIYISSNNLDKNIWHIVGNAGAWDSLFGFNLQYLGTGSSNNNDLVLWAHALSSTHVEVYRVHQDGSFIFKSTPKVGTTSVSLAGHKHAYTDLTGSTTTADQAIVSNGTANGWTLKTLGSRAFDSTAYIPIAGNVTMTGPLDMGVCLDAKLNTGVGVNFGSVGRIGTSSSGLGMYSTGDIWIRPKCTLTDSSFSTNYGLAITNTTFTYNGNTVYHSGNIPSNSKDAAGIVPKGVASRVYMTDSTGAPSWTLYDTTVTLNSGKLVTSGAVYTAIANNVAGAVLYLGTVTSSSDMIALTSAGKGDFARVTSSFTFTDATGSSVTAHVGDVVYLTNDTPGTASNWIVAHTEIDTDTWTAASTSAAGYIPKLVTGGANLAAASTDYVLAYINGATTPVWRKLPANAYKDTWIAWTGATSSAAGTAGYMPGAAVADRTKFLRGDGSWIALAPSISAGTSDTNKVKITVGGENSSEFTIPYATNADKVDGYHENSFMHRWSADGSYFTKFLTFTRATEKGWLRFYVYMRDNSSTTYGGEYLVQWGYDATNENKTISITCLYSVGIDSSTSVYAVRKSGTQFDLVFSAKTSGAHKIGFGLYGHSALCTINNYTVTSYAQDAGPTATYTSSAQGLICNITGNASTASKWQTARTLTIGNTGKSVDGSNDVSWTLAEIGASATTHTHSVKINGSTKTIAAPGETAVDLGTYLVAYGTSNANIDDDWGLSVKTFDPIPSGTPPELNPNITLLSLGSNFGRRKMLAFTYNNDNIYYRRHVQKSSTVGDVEFTSWVKLAHSGNVVNKSATIGTSLTTIATIAGVDIKASLPTAARGESAVTSGVITPTSSGTTKFLCEDGTWKTPSYTTNTDEKVKQSETTTTNYRGVVLGYNTNATANTGVSGAVTNQVYISNNLTVQPSTGNVVSLGRGTFAGLTSSSGDLVFNSTGNIVWNSATWHLRICAVDDSTADTAVFTFQLSSNSGSSWSDLMTIRDNGKVVATTFVGALSGNATTATNLSKTSGTNRGYLYLSANTTTACTGVGSVAAAADIGIPYIGYASNANTYGIYKDLFYLSGTIKYIGNNVHSNKFACIKTKDSVTDDWNGSSTSGSSGGSSTTYTAGDGISINNGTISTTRKEWYGTEAQFNSLSSLDNNTTYYIMAT